MNGGPGRHRRPWLSIGSAVVLAALCVSPVWSQVGGAATVVALPGKLALAGRVTDAAHILTADQVKSLDHYLTGFEARSRHQMMVVTVSSLEGRDIADYTRDLANGWGIGRKGHDDGILVLVAPNERKARIAVGYGLEKILTDRYCQHVIDTMMLPRFRAGRYYDGLILGVTGLARVARRV